MSVKTQKKRARKTLPNKPSALIRLALDDLRAVERQKKRYSVDMGVWHGPAAGVDGRDICLVCFAGAVMALTMRLPDYADVRDPSQLMYVGAPEATRDKLYALNDLRVGDVGDAFDSLGRKRDHNLPARIGIADYGLSPGQFKRDMTKLARLLEKRGH